MWVTFNLFRNNKTYPHTFMQQSHYSLLYTKNIFSNLQELFSATFEFTFINKPTKEMLASLLTRR